MDTSEIIDVDAYEESKIEEMEVQVNDVLQNDVTIAEEKKNFGNDAYKAQNYAAALKLYSDAISLCPNVPAYYGNRAACYMMTGDNSAALIDARKSIQLDERFEKGYIRLCKCLIILGDIVGAEQTIKKWLAIEPKSTSLKTEAQNCKILREIEEKANANYEKNEYRTTVYHMDSALKIATNCQRYKLRKAECLALLGRTDEAYDIAVTTMKLDATSSDAIYVRGLCLYYTDNLEKGLSHFERVLVLDPDHPKAKQMRTKAKILKEKKEKGNELFKSGQYREAHTVYTEALKIDEFNKDINSKLFYNRALVNAKLGNIRDAITDCTEALKSNPNYLKAILRRAKCYYDLENFEECVKDYEAAFQLEKTHATKNLLRDAKLALKKSKRKDYYKILGIQKNATDDEIKKAYRKRALIHHPDRHASSSNDEKKEQEKKFKEVGEAYKILSDPNKKARYDNGQDLDDDQGSFDPNQMFCQFFSFPQGGNSNFNFQFG
jgi:DnaJ family protein C protein 7